MTRRVLDNLIKGVEHELGNMKSDLINEATVDLAVQLHGTHSVISAKYSSDAIVDLIPDLTNREHVLADSQGKDLLYTMKELEDDLSVFVHSMPGAKLKEVVKEENEVTFRSEKKLDVANYFPKAFYKVDQSILCKLEAYDIQSPLLSWLSAFLQGRRLRVKISASLANEFH
ncbi:hypothetical protein J6590_021079 [Homalodisca vitripennis]|nr:hypothetical protein J6590_098234 [Homalodisca vitripennis]KAG8283183.1 hypothetical protein J6590_021079 [Homalodisca vitripennis]